MITNNQHTTFPAGIGRQLTGTGRISVFGQTAPARVSGATVHLHPAPEPRGTRIRWGRLIVTAGGAWYSAGAIRGRNPAGGRRLDPARPEALARGRAE